MRRESALPAIDQAARADALERTPHARLVRRGVSDRDVLEHGAREQEHVLRHHREAPPQLRALDGPDVAPVDQDRAAADLVEAQQERCDGGLAGARRADDRDLLAALHVEAHAAQHGLPGAILEAHVVEADDDVARHRRTRRRHVDDRRRVGFVDVEQAEDALRRRERLLHDGVLRREVTDRHEEALDVVVERDDGADVDERGGAVGERAGAHSRVPEDERDAGRGDRLDGRVEQRVELDRALVRVAIGAVDQVVVLGARGFPPERLHDRDALHLLAEVRVELRGARPDRPKRGARIATEDLDDRRERRQRGEGDEREAPVEHQHEGDDPDEHEDVTDGGDGA